MQIPIPNKEYIDKSSLQRIDVVGFRINASGPASAVFNQTPDISLIVDKDTFEIADDLLKDVQYVQFKYAHKNAVKMGTWQNRENNQVMTLNDSACRYTAPTIAQDGFVEANLRAHTGWQEVYPRQTFKNNAEYYNTELLEDYERNELSDSTTIDSTGVLTLANGIVSNRGLVYTDTMQERYVELTRFNSIDLLKKDQSEIAMYTRTRSNIACNSNVEYVAGRGVNLFPLFSNVNYCHNLLDFSSMLGLLEDAGISLSSFDWFVVPGSNFKTIKKLKAFAGIEDSKTLNVGMRMVDGKPTVPNKGWLFDELVSPSINAFGDYYNGHGFNYIRSKFLSEPSGRKRKTFLYLTRENSGRDISNKQEVEKLLERYGFEPINCSGQYDLPNIMAKADIVIGAHGAAMANCVFCSPGAILIDLLPKYYCKRYFASLAHAVNMTYIGIICKGAESKYTAKSCGPHSDKAIQVNVPQLKKILDNLT